MSTQKDSEVKFYQWAGVFTYKLDIDSGEVEYKFQWYPEIVVRFIFRKIKKFRKAPRVDGE